MKKSESGFGIVPVLLVVLALGVVGSAGWYVWHKNSAPQPASTTNNTEAVKTFDCKGEFSVKYPASLQATMTSSTPPQCLISNVSQDTFPAVGPLPPEQLGLFFTTYKTSYSSSPQFVDNYAQSGEGIGALEIRNKEAIVLDNGQPATLATTYGGHPTAHETYLFAYIKDGLAITTTYPTNSNHKAEALQVLKTIQ